jgi:exosome complex component CSL4
MNVCIPGDSIEDKNSESGSSVYIDEDGVSRACLLGHLAKKGSSTDVLKIHSADERILKVGIVIIAKVVKLAPNSLSVEIVSIEGGERFMDCPRGLLRREDVRQNEVDKLSIEECFLPGDVIRAILISLGDTRQYYLSTAAAEFGVVEARSMDGNLMIPVSWNCMRDPVTGKEEKRKSAKPRS